MIRALLILSAALAAGACGHAPLATPESLSSEGADVNNTITVEVVSHAFRDATVYLSLGASRQRLGLAGGNSTSVFKVPWNAQLANSAQANLHAEQIGDDAAVVSSELHIAAGSRIVWTLSGQFYESSLEVY
ncbi:MAG: hypothetical protein R3B48_29240 [Kofleriaceae bacterium]